MNRFDTLLYAKRIVIGLMIAQKNQWIIQICRTQDELWYFGEVQGIVICVLSKYG